MKKARPTITSKNPISKSGTSSVVPKSSGKSSSILGSTPKTSGVPSSSSKSFSSTYSSTSYNVPKKGKSSTSFGIIWIPTKKRNKHKDLAYNYHKNDGPRDRSPSMYNFMSGDSSNHQSFMEKKEDKSCLLVPEKNQTTSISIISAGTVVASEISPELAVNREEKVDLIKQNEETKEAAGDTGDTSKDMQKEAMESSEKVLTTPPQCNRDKQEDNVDSVFLRSPPPHKARSAASTIEEESCGMKCLYYTLQCCDCVLM